MLSRRELLRAVGMGVFGVSASGVLPGLAAAAAATDRAGQRDRRCVLLWMTGGPSQIDTFDLKPGHANGGEFKEIPTSVPGLRISEHLPKLAALAEHLAIVRSVSTKEGDHGRGSYLVRTGHAPMGPVRYPAIGASLSKELADAEALAPAYVSIAPNLVFNREAFSPGFLGPAYGPLTVDATDAVQPQQAANAGELRVDDLSPPQALSAEQTQSRLELWRMLQQNFLAERNGAAPRGHDTIYQRAIRLSQSAAAGAFDLSAEASHVRDAYGRGRFGQGCLMARRLLERGAAFVEVSLGAFNNMSFGWDTHINNFQSVKALSAELDAGWSALIRDLAQRGLLESTTIIWLGEFGRTPKISGQAGRDHFPNAWTTVLAGGGIRGGQAFGRTSADGMSVEDSPVAIGDVLATLCRAVGVPPEVQNISEQGRPIRIAEGTPIEAILT